MTIPFPGTLPCASALLLGALAAPAASAQSVTLFGQGYQVQRFDYKQSIQWTNPVAPHNQQGLIRIEGAWALGNDRFLVSTSHQDQSVPGTYANFILEIQANHDAQGNVTGFSYVRTVVENDPALLSSPFDLRAGGLAVNPTAIGIGANGNVLAADGGATKVLRAYDVATGALIPFGPMGDGLHVAPTMTDLTDVTVVTEGPQADWRLYLMDEAMLALHAWTLDGVHVSSFPIGILANPSAGAADPKGLAWLPDLVTFPAQFHGLGGVLLVSMGDQNSGLQAFRRDGTELGFEPIDNTIFQTSSTSIQPKIEAVATDPSTGRLFCFMEKGSLVDNWVWVLTPDCNGNGLADALEIQSGAQTDLDGDGIPDGCQAQGVVFCPGDGSATACPCGNASPVGAGAGCLSSFGTGARLRAYGTPSLAADTLLLAGSDMPDAPALYAQGSAQQSGGVGVAFGDGLRCIAGTIARLGTLVNAGGSSAYPPAGGVAVSVRGGIVAPGTFHYQVWYRNSATFCTSATFNLSNGVSIVWQP